MDGDPIPIVCVTCGATNADPRPWDSCEPSCPDCQDRATNPNPRTSTTMDGENIEKIVKDEVMRQRAALLCRYQRMAEVTAQTIAARSTARILDYLKSSKDQSHAR